MKTRKLILIHIAVLAALSVLAVFGCPLFHLIGLTCPGCGLTRAYAYAFRGDFATAFRYNPFFFTLPLYVFVFAHRSCAFMRRFRRAADIFLTVYTIVLITFTVGRNCGLISGFIPLRGEL